MQRLHNILPPTARQSFLTICEELLLTTSTRIRFEPSRSWASQFSKSAGFYAVFEFDELAYVGESGSLRGRMCDLLDTRHHTLRRSLGEERFGELDGFLKATSKRKFPPHIEQMVVAHMAKWLSVSAIQPPFGRREIEEYIIVTHKPQFNKKKQRGA